MYLYSAEERFVGLAYPRRGGAIWSTDATLGAGTTMLSAPDFGPGFKTWGVPPTARYVLPLALTLALSSVAAPAAALADEMAEGPSPVTPAAEGNVGASEGVGADAVTPSSALVDVEEPADDGGTSAGEAPAGVPDLVDAPGSDNTEVSNVKTPTEEASAEEATFGGTPDQFAIAQDAAERGTTADGGLDEAGLGSTTVAGSLAKSLGVANNDVAATGTCGENLTWSYDATTKTLTISGTGAMWDYDDFEKVVPWNSYLSGIQTVVISEGVTSIGDRAFQNAKLTSVTVPEGITSIGRYAFYESNLAAIDLPASVATIGKGAFNFSRELTSINVADGNSSYTSRDGVLFASNLKTLICYPNSKSGDAYTIPDGVEEIVEYAFYDPSQLEKVVISDSVTTIWGNAFNRYADYYDRLTISFTKKHAMNLGKR